MTPKLPVNLKPPLDGDVICAFLCNLEDDGSVGKDTHAFALGWHMIPRERWAYEKAKFSYSA